jgi:hypothetical protein
VPPTSLRTAGKVRDVRGTSRPSITESRITAEAELSSRPARQRRRTTRAAPRGRM